MAKRTELPETGFVRLSTILAIIPVSKSTFYAWVAAGKIPRPIRLGSRISAWRVEDIRAVLDGARDD